MARSECLICRQEFGAESLELMYQQLLQHHLDSAIRHIDKRKILGKEIETEVIQHKCGSFSLYDNNDDYLGTRAYVHGVYSSNISSIIS